MGDSHDERLYTGASSHSYLQLQVISYEIEIHDAKRS